MTAFQDVYPQVPPSPSLPKGIHRGSEVTVGHPLMPNTGQHVRARKSLLPLLVGVLVPIVATLLVLWAVSLFGQPSEAGVVPPVLQVAVSPSACTFPDGY